MELRLRNGRESPIRRGGACPARRCVFSARDLADCDGHKLHRRGRRPRRPVGIAPPPRFRDSNELPLIRRGRIARHPCGLSGPQAHCLSALFRDGRGRPLRKKAAFVTKPEHCGKQMPRPRRRAGIKSEKAGFRLKNRLIVIFEVKSGFFPPLWGSRGAGPLGVGSALGRLTPAIRIAPDRACGCRQCLHLALPGFAALNRGPTRQTPHHLVQRDFSRFLFWSQKRNNPTAGCRFLLNLPGRPIPPLR